MESRVLSIELFFDLVFVFTITQLTSVLVAEPDGVGVARVVVVFANVWWMYAGFAWLTNAVPPRSRPLRLLLLVAMAGFFVVALAIPGAFGDAGMAFGLGYLLVTLVHTGMFLLASEERTLRAMTRLGPSNLVTAALLVAAGFAGGGVRWALVAAAAVLHWASPAITPVGGFRIAAAHFVERHGAVVLIALGESVIAVGIGVRGRPLEPALVATAVLGLALVAALWWLYFDGEEDRARAALDGAGDDRNPWLALFSFGYAFLPVLVGIVVLAAGIHEVLLHYGGHAAAVTAWLLAAGAALYIGGLVAFRAVLRTGPLTVRVAMAGAALATVVVGLGLSPVAQLAVLTLIVAGGIAVESLPRLAPSAN